MISRRLLGLGGAVTALVVVAGIASQGRPLSARRGAGPTATFFDYLATTLLVFAIVMAIVIVWSLFGERTGALPKRRGPWHFLSYAVSLAAGIALALVIVHSGFEQRLKQAGLKLRKPAPPTGTLPAAKQHGRIRNARIRWDEIAILLVLAGGAVVVLVTKRQARRAPRLWTLRREEAVAQAFDESLDDLRNDPDVRRAIIAAYARMERALASIGLPRRPSEAPFEYAERALTSLSASADAAERLTALFERAKFSQHEPAEAMRHEAIDALVAIRDELRQPAAA